ncbi:MAG: hypothetical protein ACRD59_10405 [Candidatus Acidiferrales bacterium]
MNTEFRPTQKYPPLTDERLSLIAEALREVRNEALSLYAPLSGDNGWSHGCRVYARSCFRVGQLAQQHAWLRIVGEEPKLRFTFAIEGIPIRFYRGSPDDPPGNYLITTFGELQQRQLFEGLHALDKILRLAIETDREGRVSSIKLVELDEVGNATGLYSIPVHATVSNTIPMEPKPIHLEPVALEPREDEEREKSNKKTKAR